LRDLGDKMGLFDIFKKKKSMTLDEVVKKMKKEGYSDSEIKEQLIGRASEQLLGGLGVSKERIKEIIEDIEMGRNKSPISDDKVIEYRWVIEKCDIDDDTKENILEECGVDFISSEGYCEDCLNRKDEIGTMEYFRTIGLPNSGFSMCQFGCGCRLEKIE
jgi:hypothetical protein